MAIGTRGEILEVEVGEVIDRFDVRGRSRGQGRAR